MKKTIQQKNAENAKKQLEKRKIDILNKLLKLLTKWQVENLDDYHQISIQVDTEKKDGRLNGSIKVHGVKTASFENTEYFYIWIYPDGKVLVDTATSSLITKACGQLHASVAKYLAKNKASYDDINLETKRLFEGILFLTF